MDTVYRIITVVAALLTLAATIWGLLSARRERRITVFSSGLSAFLSAILLPVFILLVGVRLNPLVGLPILVLGLMVGCAGGAIAKLTYKDGQVVGKNSWLFLLLWGASLVLAQLINLSGSRLTMALGFTPIFLTTGTQVGRDGTVFLRRLFMKPPPAVPATTYPQHASPSVPGPSRTVPPRFAEVERRFAELLNRYQAGEMDIATYSAARQELMIHDGAGGYWVPAEGGGWYWYDGQEWVRREPSFY